MKTPVLYRFVLVGLILALPFFSKASTRIVFETEEFTFADSLRRQPPQKPDERRPDDDKQGRGKGRPDIIKEVPRSRRLPKPTAVTDRVRIKRPPVRPGVIRRNLGLH